MKTLTRNSRVRDTCWGGEFTGTVVRAGDESVFVMFDGHFAEYEMRPADVEPLGCHLVEGHEADPSGPVRRILVTALGPVWHLLPGRVQGFLCNCPLDRGEA
jgi:hypothetical protein